jgi:hypothetical protein
LSWNGKLEFQWKIPASKEPFFAIFQPRSRANVLWNALELTLWEARTRFLLTVHELRCLEKHFPGTFFFAGISLEFQGWAHPGFAGVRSDE